MNNSPNLLTTHNVTQPDYYYFQIKKMIRNDSEGDTQASASLPFYPGRESGILILFPPQLDQI